MPQPEAYPTDALSVDLVEQALHSKPALVVVDPGILPIMRADLLANDDQRAPDQPVDAPHGYAWTRLVVWIVSRDAYRTVDAESVVRVILCPSLNYEGSLALAEELNRRGGISREIVRGLLDERSMQQLKADETTRDLLPVASAFSKANENPGEYVHDPASSIARQLLESAVQKCLYELTIDESRDVELFAANLRKTLLSQNCVYEQSPIPGNLESSWGVRYELDLVSDNYLKIVSSLGIPSAAALEARRRLRDDPRDRELQLAARDTGPAGPDIARRYIEWQVAKIVSAAHGNPQIRPFRVLTRDIAPPELIAAGSLANLPPSLATSHLLGHAIVSLYNNQQHSEGDAYEEIPAPDNSLAGITIIDGVPYHYPRANSEAELEEFKEKNLNMLKMHYAKLAPGAELVIFPWDVADGSPDQVRILDEVVGEFAQWVKHGVIRRVFHKDTLIDWMSDTDREIAENLSLIFKSDRDHFEALIVRKPREPLNEYQINFNEMLSRLSNPGDGTPLWPFNDRPGNTPDELNRYKIETVEKLYEMYEASEFGTDLVIFPWDIAGGTPEQVRALEEIVVELGRRVHHGVDRCLYHRSALNHPPDESEYYEALVISRPREALAKIFKRAVGKVVDSSAN